MQIDISVVVPVRNEQQNIEPLLGEFALLRERVPVGEVIYVDDGSTDGTAAILRKMKTRYPFLRVVSHSRSAGQSAATFTGVRVAENSVVVTIDGDGQNDPADIARVYRQYLDAAGEKEPVMVIGQRLKRQDNWIRKISSRVANGIRAAILQDGTRDTGCSLKMFRQSDFLALPYFDHMHRFLPALMTRQHVRVLHVDVSHRPRLQGTSKYGLWDRLWAGIVDLAGVMWLQRRANTAITITEE